MFDLLVAEYAYAASIAVIAIGLFALIAKRNLMKKLIGLTIVQAGVILLWVASATRPDATVPVLLDTHGPIIPTDYVNPLPHTLMLTAIVVGVATTGVAFALLISIHQRYGTLHEPELLDRIGATE